MNIASEDNLVISSCKTNGILFEVIEFCELQGSSDVRIAEKVFFLRSSGMRLKFVRIVLDEEVIRLAPGALNFMQGKLSMKGIGQGSLIEKMTRRMKMQNVLAVSEIRGTGEVHLKPGFGHFLLTPMDDGELLVDRSLVYAVSGGLVVSEKRISLPSLEPSKDRLLQAQISGTGVAVIFSSAPVSEIQEINLDDETLTLDGSLVLMRESSVKLKSNWGAAISTGASRMQIFSGSGRIWITPTRHIYTKLLTSEGMADLALPPGSHNGSPFPAKPFGAGNFTPRDRT